MQDDNRRLERGRAKLISLHADSSCSVVEALDDIAPDFARYIYEFAYGDIYSRPGLVARDRQIGTIAALTALGHNSQQLKAHILAGMNTGLTREEIVEVIIQMAVYAGFPAAMNGLAVAKEAFSEFDKHPC